MTAVVGPAERRSSRGGVKLSGLAISAPGWQDQIETWCEVVGLDPPATGSGVLSRLGSTRRRPLSLTLVDADPGEEASSIVWLAATTADLDEAVSRAVARGAPLLSEPTSEAGGARVALVKGPMGIPVRIEERLPRARLTALADPAPRRAEAYLRTSALVSGVAALAVAGYFSHLVVEKAPHRQISFAFLIGFCTLFAAAAALTGWPSGVLGGEAACLTGQVRPLRSEVAGVPSVDPAGGWVHWRSGVSLGILAAAVSALALGLASAFLLGRPLGFWGMWSWSAAISGTAMVLAGALGRRRGLLFSGRQLHGLPVSSVPPVPLLRRAWVTGALPLAALSGLVNAGLAWSAYRYGVSGRTFSSDLLGSVVVTSAFDYLLGRQWGRVDVLAGRVTVPDGMRLPPRVRLGAQGLLFGMVAELVILTLAGHALSRPLHVAQAVAVRAIAGVLAGAFGFGLGAVAGALNTAADQDEGVL